MRGERLGAKLGDITNTTTLRTHDAKAVQHLSRARSEDDLFASQEHNPLAFLSDVALSQCSQPEPTASQLLQSAQSKLDEDAKPNSPQLLCSQGSIRSNLFSQSQDRVLLEQIALEIESSANFDHHLDAASPLLASQQATQEDATEPPQSSRLTSRESSSQIPDFFESIRLSRLIKTNPDAEEHASIRHALARLLPHTFNHFARSRRQFSKRVNVRVVTRISRTVTPATTSYPFT
jgi:hypothetical protein